jgi:sensor histidine kinase YesM
MQHPLFRSRLIFGLYVLAWVLIVSIQTLAFFQLFPVSWYFAIIDSLLFGSLFFILGIGAWYFIRYMTFEKGQLISMLFEHIASAFVLVSLWVYGGSYLLSLIFSNSTAYVNLLWDAIPWRYSNGFLFYIIMVVVYYLHANTIQQQERKERELKLRSSLKSAEIDLLRSKLNPHFLFNSLNSLNALIQTDPQDAVKMLIQLSDFLRFSIEKDQPEKIELKTELENIDRYIAIEQVRFGKRLKFSKQITKESLGMKLPAMILQPLLENAVKYGVGSRLDEVEIKLRAHLNSSVLELELENTYDSKVAISRGSGHGLENVRKRLDIIYRKRATFKIEKLAENFKIEMKIPQII